MTWSFGAEYHQLSAAELAHLATRRGIIGGTVTAYERELTIIQLRESDRVRLGIYVLGVGALAPLVDFVWHLV